MNDNRGMRRSRRRGLRSLASFTLIEMMVCVGIIALLAALTIPGIQSALAAARATKCASNLHQIGVGMAGYIADNGGGFPMPDNDNRVFYEWIGTPVGIGLIVDKGYLALPPGGAYTLDPTAKGIYVCPDLLPLSKYVAGGNQITYKVDQRNGRYIENADGTGQFISQLKLWNMMISGRAQVACSDIHAHNGRPNVLYGDGHVERATTAMAIACYGTNMDVNNGAGDFSKLDLNATNN